MAIPVTKMMLYVSLIQVVVYCATEASDTNLTEHNSIAEKDQSGEQGDGLSLKNEAFVKCPKFHLEPRDYVLYPNATAYVEEFHLTYTEPFYLIKGDTLVVCRPPDDKFMNPVKIFRLFRLHMWMAIGIVVSMVCLLIHLIVFVLVPDLKNVPGCNMASFCASLFLAYVLMVVYALVDDIGRIKAACVAAAVGMHFLLLACISWMFIIAFEVFRTVDKATSNLRATSNDFNVRKFLCNNLIAWGYALVFSAAAMIADNVEGIPSRFRPHFEEMCWFSERSALLAYLVVPAFTAISINCILCVMTVYKIFANRIKSSPDSRQSKVRKSSLMYFRLVLITGVTWIASSAAHMAGSFWLWNLCSAVNTTHGLFILICFTCAPKVRKYFRLKFFPRNTTANSLPTTFQNYGFASDTLAEKGSERKL